MRPRPLTWRHRSPSAWPRLRPRARRWRPSALRASLPPWRLAKPCWKSWRGPMAAWARSRRLCHGHSGSRSPRRDAVRGRRAGRRARCLAHFDGARAWRRNRPRAGRARRSRGALRLGRWPDLGGPAVRRRCQIWSRAFDRRQQGRARDADPCARPRCAPQSMFLSPRRRRSAALTKRVRESFDPYGVLNPGRM